MKKYLHSTWMRVLSTLVCAISIVALVIGALGFAFVTAFRDTEGVYESGYREVAENYALYAIDMLEQGREEELKKSFEDKGINCSIQLVINTPNEQNEVISTIEKQVLIGEVEEDGKVELEVVAGSEYRYRQNSLLGVLIGYASYSDGSDWIEYPIEKVVFVPSSGMFYYQTALGLYQVEDIQVLSKDEGGYYDYSLIEQDGNAYYYNGYYKIILDSTQYQNWEWVRIHGHAMKLASRGEWGDEIEVLAEGTPLVEDIQTGEYEIWGDEISTPAPEYMDMYQVQISWNPVAHTSSLFLEWWNLSNALNMFDTIAVPMIFISFIFMVTSFGLMVYSANSEKEKLSIMAKTPVACFSVIVYVILFCMAAFSWEIGNWLIGSDIGRLSDIIEIAGLVAFILVWIALGWFQNIVTRIKCKSFWRTTEIYYVYKLIKSCWHILIKPFVFIWSKIKGFVKTAQENIPLVVGGMAGLILVTIIELFIFYWFGLRYGYGDALAAFLWIKVGEGVALFVALFQMNEMLEGSRRVASGDMSQPIDTSRMFWKFKEHGENINKVSDGIALAVNERMKSEHFKTELITNVSHDIKTPLTSIINYVDLIKKEDIQDEKVQEYVDVLDRQSARLKKLIEDLMEASKASTGNLAVNLEECDVDVLLTQMIGEFEEKLQKSQLEVVVDKPDHPVKIMTDGRHMWRVLDNLLNNACKYSLPGTRVYVTLQQQANDIVITFKNISKDALNIPSDELMERFVRGDSSRNTEGSGLGLSIAQSLTELMQGNMKLDIDGDLFKVTLRFPTIVTK